MDPAAQHAPEAGRRPARRAGRSLAGRILLPAGCALLLALAGLLLWMDLAPCPHPLDGRDFSRVVTDRDGGILRIALTRDQKYRLRARMEDIPERAMEAVIEYEDRWFWLHPGVNPLSLARSCLGMLLGGRRMGGSTLTMQVARLAFGLKTTSVSGKLEQILWALRLERHWSKTDILEAYFTLAPYGGNVEGLPAAALIHFRKGTERLTAAESEALMLVPQNPVRRRPAQDNAVFQEAVRRQWHGDGEFAPLRVFGTADLPFRAPHVCDEVLARPDLAGEERIRTTIAPGPQHLLEAGLARFAARHAPLGIRNAAALLLHWPSMEIRALVGSADFHDASISGQLDGTRARRSPGSTLKPLIYALGLEQGLIHPLTLLPDTPRSFAGYDPENFDKSFRGPISAAEALRASRNIPALNLAARLRAPGLHGFLKRAGVRFLFDERHYGLALVLGGAEITMREAATLYAMLANGGVLRRPRLIRENGAEDGVALLSPEAAFVTLSMLEDNDPAHRAPSRGGAVLPLRLKTGTSNGFRDAWTCGIVGPYVLVVWAGSFDNASNPLLVGGRVAAPLFLELARSLAAAEPMEDRLSIPGPDLNVERLKVCAATGDLDISLCPDHAETWYIPGVSPLKSSGVFRAIHVDRITGLRACMPEAGRTERVVWEFWPSDLAEMFARAGLPRPPPPPFEPQCREDVPPGRPPEIRRPKAGLSYHVRPGSDGRMDLVLLAHADADAGRLRWFVNGRHAGDSAPGEALIWRAQAGPLRILVVDEAGRSSERRIRIGTAPR